MKDYHEIIFFAATFTLLWYIAFVITEIKEELRKR